MKVLCTNFIQKIKLFLTLTGCWQGFLLTIGLNELRIRLAHCFPDILFHVRPILKKFFSKRMKHVVMNIFTIRWNYSRIFVYVSIYGHLKIEFAGSIPGIFIRFFIYF